MTAPLPDIRPISDLRTKLGEIEATARESGEPIVLVRNGTPSLVVMDSDAFNRRLVEERHARKLREAEIEERYRSETVSLEESRSRIDALFAAIGQLSEEGSDGRRLTLP